MALPCRRAQVVHRAVAGARQRLFELGLEDRLLEFTRSRPKARFDRVEPAVKKPSPPLGLRLQLALVVTVFVMA